MKKYLLIIVIAVFAISCEKSDNAYKPEWLNALIQEIEDDDYYTGSTIYRHDWKSEYYYHLEIPVSSCAFCEIYDKDGQKVSFNTIVLLEDYINNRKNEHVVWKW